MILSFKDRLLTVFCVVMLSSTLHAAGEGLHYPVDSTWTGAYADVERLIREEDWLRALEGILDLHRRRETGDLPPGSTVVPAGNGFAVGTGAALRRLVALIPEDRRETFLQAFEPIVEKIWRDARNTRPADAQARIRNRLVRDFPDSTLALTLIRDEIDMAALSGDFDRVRRLATAARDHDAADAALRSRLQALIDRLPAATADGDTAPARSPLLLRTTPGERVTGDSTTKPESAGQYLLGSVQARHRLESTELTSHVFQQLRLRPPVISPILASPNGQSRPEEGSTPSAPPLVESVSGDHGAVDLPLPFFPATRGDRVFIQTYEEVVALGTSNLRPIWSTAFREGRFESIGAVRAPTLGEGIVVATAGEHIAAFDAETGLVLWHFVVVYDRGLKDLVVVDAERFEDLEADRGHQAEIDPAAEPKGDEPPPPADPDGVVVDGGAPEGGAADENALLVPVTLTTSAESSGGFAVAAAAKVDAEILTYVLRLDRAGDLDWKTYLGSANNLDFLGLGATLSPPLVHEGQITLLTNLGNVATLDALDGQILWIHAYDRLSDRGKLRAIEDWNRWQPNPILWWRDILVIAPQDSESLLAVSAKDGLLRWRVPRDRHTTLLGAVDGACVLGGPVVSAIEIADESALGRERWRWSPPSTSFVSLGRATLDGDSVLVSAVNALYTLDVSDGSQRAASLWDFRTGGGNLLRLDGNLLAVASSSEFLVYNHLEDEKRRVAALPAGVEERYLQSARLALKEGDTEEAVRVLNEWVRQRFPEPAPNSRLDQNLFDLAENLRYTIEIRGEDDPNAIALLRVLSRAERVPSYKAIAAFRAAQIALRRGQFRDAVEIVRDALDRDLGEVYCSVNHFLAIPGRVLAEGILDAVRRSDGEGPAAFTDFEWAAQESLARARQQGSQSAFAKVAQGFPLTQAAALAYLELANLFRDQQNLQESQSWLLEYLQDFPDTENYVSITLRLVDSYAKLGRYAEARDVLVTLAARHPDAPTGATSLSERVRDYVRRRLQEPGFREIDLPLEGRWLRFPIQLRWRSPANLQTTRRDFLETEGTPPEALRERFLVASNDLVECREIETGLRSWALEFAMVPDFVAQRFSFRPQRRGLFAGESILYQDPNNLVMIDAKTGERRWSRVFDRYESTPPIRRNPSEPIGAGVLRSTIGETIQGVGANADHVFVRTSAGRLVGLDLQGTEVFAVKLSERTTRYVGDPIVLDSEVALVRYSPLEIVYLDPTSGAEKDVFRVPGADPKPNIAGRSGVFGSVRSSLRLGRDRAVFMTTRDVVHVDLSERRIISRFNSETAILNGLWEFPAYEDQVVIYAFENQGPRWFAGVSLSTGDEVWRFDKLKGKQATMSIRSDVHADGKRLYVLYGAENRFLTALDVRAGPEPDRYTALRLWADDIDLGLKFGRQLDLLVTQDSIIIPESLSSTVSVYEKGHGTSRRALAEELDRFLVEKRSFECDVRDGLLVVLSDRGDGGFGSKSKRLDLDTERRKIERLKRYLTDPTDWDNVTWLALTFFQEKNSEAALEMLNRALLSEHLPSLESPGMYQRLRFLFDGIKEEAIKTQRPDDVIVCRRFRTPPSIDGDLRETWNITEAKLLRDLRSINLIPSTGQDDDIWKGEEDLSARLYTGWDDKYFYFALDVEDNRIYPYDKEAEFWKGDCLIIGLDPEGDGGIYQKGNDQLLTLALTIPKRNKPGDEEGEEGEDEQRNKPKGQYSVKKKDDDSGVVYEAAIPWVSFDPRYELAPPPTQKRFGLSLVVTDDDSGQGATKMMSIKPSHLLPKDNVSRSIWRHLVPEYFPKVVLE